MARAKTIQPFGSWASPVSAVQLGAKSLRLSEPRLFGNHAFWLEGRPDNKGRSVLVTHDGNGPVDVTPSEFDVATRAGAYGGGAYVVTRDGVFLTSAKDGRIYRVSNGQPEAVTSKSERRFADLSYDADHKRLIAVCERKDADGAPVTSIVSIEQNGTVRDLYDGPDFIASPALSSRSQLVWLEWNNPMMPWDGCRLMMSGVTQDGGLATSPRLIAGSDTESIFQPMFAPDGSLWFVSDANGWWNLHRFDSERIQAMAPDNSDFGQPQWVFGMSTYGFGPGGDVYGARCRDGIWTIYKLAAQTGDLVEIASSFTAIDAVAVNENGVLVAGASSRSGTEITRMDFNTGHWKTLCDAGDPGIDSGSISLPEAMALRAPDGRTVHGFCYPPCNAEFNAPPGEKPPLIVRAHGGPTAHADNRFDLRTQYWTTRGFTVFDVNYRGSTGYGRAFRQSLLGGWGRYDAEDAADSALALVNEGLVDRDRMAISGRSAGGLTVLTALIDHDVFKAGASYYGVTDLKLLFEHTHRFERYYTLRMLGIDEPDDDSFRAASPAHKANGLNRPVIFFQGMKDEVVPPEQTERMIDAMKANGVPYAYLSFPEERHGFRRAETIERAFSAELGFIATIFEIEPAGGMPAVEIHGLSS